MKIITIASIEEIYVFEVKGGQWEKELSCGGGDGGGDGKLKRSQVLVAACHGRGRTHP